MRVCGNDEGGGPLGGAKEPAGESPWARRFSKAILPLLAVATIGIALGLGLGFGLNHNGSGSQSPAPPPPPPNPTAPPLWQPAVHTSWQIVLSQQLSINHASPSITPDVEVFDIDMFLHQNTTVVEDLHKLNKKVICYFSAGSYEPYRPDSGQFLDSDMGNVLDGWPDEKWLNISSFYVRRIMADRIDTAASMGCDAVDPDNMDGYLNNNGLNITIYEAVDYLEFLADKARVWGMAIGLKNAPDLIPKVLDAVQFSVNEQCAAQNNCAAFAAFIQAGKPVFQIEYPPGAGNKIAAASSKKSCTAKDMEGFSTVLKDLSLDSWVEYCDGSTASTKVVS